MKGVETMKKSVKTICYIMFVTFFTFSLSCQNVKAFTLDNNSVSFEFQVNVQILNNGQVTDSSINTSNAVFEGTGQVVLFVSEQDFVFGSGLMGNNAMQFVGKPNNNISAHWSKNVDHLTNNGQEVMYYARNNGISDSVPFYLNTILNKSFPDLNTSTVIPEVDYVKGIENLKKWLQGDNSVVQHGDPNNPPVTQDNTLPVPQSLTCDLHNRYTGSTPLIIGGWSNPSNASFDAIKDTVKIHIQYKPSFQFYKRFFAVKDEIVTARDWINLGTSENNNRNKWVNAFPNTPQTDTNVIKFETLQSDMQMVASYNNNDSRDATLANGTSWRVRYEMPDGRVSYWAVYNIKAIGKMTYADDVTFQDNNDNVVSSDAVSYQNSEQTDPQNQDRDNSLLGRLKTALNNIQSLPKDMQTVADEGSSFANFLKKVWDKFPEIYILFIGGLIIAIILRILGR